MATAKPDSVSLSDRVSSSFTQLASSASSLNVASDQLGVVVSSIESRLERLHLGIEAWIDYGGWKNDENGSFEKRQIGYTRLNRAWGLAIKLVRGNEHDPEREDVETWSFGSAPRAMRADSVPALPDLLERLSKKAEATEKKIVESTRTALELENALKEASRALADGK